MLLHYLSILFVLFGLCPSIQGQEAKLTPAPGSYTGTQYVEVSGGVAGAVFYTKNGSTPTRSSPAYTGEAIEISSSTVLRLAVFEGDTPTLFGGSYLIGEPDSDLMTVSVGVDPWRLFDREYGWFEEGLDSTANWETDREHPVHVDLFEVDGRRVHGGTLGFRLFGGVSRSRPQKSFSLSGRKKYGNKRIDYPLFGDDAPDGFRFLVLRNGGSDWARSYLRDALLTGLLQDPSWDVDRQASRPARVYLNGTYWGLYHLREKINPRFLEDHHGVDKDSIDLMEHRWTVKHGSDTAYHRLHDFIRTKDLSVPAHYAELATMMDIDNFQRLQIAQTYFDNRDAGGNIRYWRPQRPDGRWRWILYDVDQGFGLHRHEGWKINTVAFNTDPAGPAWPNPPWSTLFHRRLLENPEYRGRFINRSLDYLHTDFEAEVVLEETAAAIAAIESEMPRQLARWDGKMKLWRYQATQLLLYARHRPAELREHLRDHFNAGPDRIVTVEVDPGGYVRLNDNIAVASDGLEGRYFAGLPLEVEAVAEPGYRFLGWGGEAAGLLARREVDLTADKKYELIARFEPAQHPLADRIIIHEICPKSEMAGDWLELHNRGEAPVDMKGWYLVDGSNERFQVPAVTLEAGGYLVVCKNGEAFRRAHPSVYQLVEGMPFGLDKESDRIGLYAADGSYVNAVGYRLEGQDEDSFTYALALPGLDNTEPRHWVREDGEGTPGAANPDHLRSAMLSRGTYWTRLGVGVGVLALLAVLRSMHLRPRRMS